MQKEYQDEEPAKPRNGLELADQSRMLQSEETAKAKVDRCEVACFVQGAPHEAGY